MDKRALTVGLGLVLIGVVLLACNMSALILATNVWRFWPLIVVGVGLGLVLPAIRPSGARGTSVLLIPGLPVLTTGSILFLASLFDWWDVWEWMWPLEILSLALGFALVAIRMRAGWPLIPALVLGLNGLMFQFCAVTDWWDAWEWLWPLEVLMVAGVFGFSAIRWRNIWLMIPAIIIGMNGVLFLFCAITGWWEVWAVMWTIEPLSVGLALLLIGARQRIGGLMLAGTIVCGVAGFGMFGMLSIFLTDWISEGWWVVQIAGPAVLILAGVVLLGLSLLQRRSVTQSALFKSAE